MKQAFFFLFGLSLLVSCDKGEMRRSRALLPVDHALSPVTATQGQPITVRVRSYVPNSCHRFEFLEVTNTATREYKIQAVGSKSGAHVCADVLGVVDTTATVPTPVTGAYLLRFYSNGQLFETDTVQVN